MPTKTEPFDYRLIPPQPRAPLATASAEISPHPHAAEKEMLHKVSVFIKERIIARVHGRLPDAKTIAVRLLVLHVLTDNAETTSFRSYARELGVTPAFLSKIGKEFSQELGLRTSWQRAGSSPIYAARARGVHNGTWQASDKWKQRKLREAKGRKPPG